MKLAALLYLAFFHPLMLAYRKAVEDFFLTTSHGINRDIFFCIYRGARAEAYTIQNIKAEFKVTGIFPINSRVVLGQLSKPTAKSRSKSRVNTT